MRRLIQFIRTLRVKRVILTAVVLLCVGAALLLALVAFLPTIISSPFVQERLKKSLSVSMKRPVAWSRLVVTWSDGLALSGLRLGDGPAPLLKASVADVTLVPSLETASDGRRRVALAVRVRDVQANLAPGPPKKKPPKKDPLTALAEAVQLVEKLDWPLPVDVKITAEVAPVRVSYRDPSSAHRLVLEDFAGRLAMPSLATLPIETEVSGRVTSDGRQLPPMRLAARVSGLVTAKRRIHPASARLTVDAALPGATVAARGGLGEPDGFAATGKLDLPGLLGMAKPFLPPSLPSAQGTIDLDLRAKIDAAHDLRAILAVDGAGIALSGGRIKKGKIGPLDLKLRQEIAADHLKQRVDFANGSLTVPGLMDAAWSAAVDRPSAAGRTVAASLGPVRVDLARARAVAGALLPPNFPVKELSGELFVRRLRAQLRGPDNRGDVVIEGVGVKVPRLRLALAKGELAGESVDFVVEKVAFPLAAMKPTRLDAGLSYGVGRLALAGARPVTVERVRGNLSVAVSDLDLKSPSPRRVTGAVEVKQSSDLDRVAVGKEHSIDKLHEEARLLARAGATGEIEATLPEVKLTASALSASASGKRLKSFPLSVLVTADGLRLPPSGGRPTLKRGECRVEAGDFLRLTAAAALPEATPQLVVTDGKARVDLARLAPVAAPLMPAGLAADGTAALTWDLAAPLAQGPAEKGKNPLNLARGALARLDRGEVTLALDTSNVRLPTGKGPVAVSGLRTASPLRLVVPRGGGPLRVEGGVAFAAVSGLPGAAGKVPARGGSFTLSGDLTDWKVLRLKEEARVASLGFSQVAEATVNRIEPLLEEKTPFAPATLLKHLDVTLFATADVAFPRDVQFLTGLETSGKAAAGARVNLTAGRALRVLAYADTHDFGVKLGDRARVVGVNADLLIDRTYELASSRGTEWTPLSIALVRPAAEAAPPPGAAEIAGRMREDLRGQTGGSRRFTVRSVSTRPQGLPVDLAQLEGDILLDAQEVGLNFFQMEALGGTVRGRGVIDLRPEVPTIAAACSFSNLDAALLLPPKERGSGEKGEAEITGEMELAGPLVTQERELLEGLRLKLNLRKIGSRTLERALFSLDPYERNEQLVAQRKLLRLGTLKRLRATALDGAFSLDGEARVKGIDVALPSVERIRLSELAVRKQMAKAVAGISAARKFLELLRADMIVVGPKGEISLKRRLHEQ